MIRRLPSGPRSPNVTDWIGAGVRRWEAVAERDWRVDCAAGVVLTDEERRQAALDSLIETRSPSPATVN